MEPNIHELFKSYKLNRNGQEKLLCTRMLFTNLLENLEAMNLDDREMAIVKTKLQEASFFAVRAISTQAGNQE